MQEYLTCWSKTELIYLEAWCSILYIWTLVSGMVYNWFYDLICPLISINYWSHMDGLTQGNVWKAKIYFENYTIKSSSSCRVNNALIIFQILFDLMNFSGNCRTNVRSRCKTAIGFILPIGFEVRIALALMYNYFAYCLWDFPTLVWHYINWIFLKKKET